MTSTTNCQIRGVRVEDGVLSFTRSDEVLPILPPGPLPPRRQVRLEERSRYLLRVSGLESGAYEIRCEGKLVGVVEARALAEGVNLNSVLLDSGRVAPWHSLAQEICQGKGLDRIGRTRWALEIRKQASKGVVDAAPRLLGATRQG